MSAEDIYRVMKEVNGQLETLLKREDFVTKSELAKYTQLVQAQQVPAPDPAKVAQLLLPALLAQLPKQVPLKLTVSTKGIADILSPVVNQQVTAIEASNERLLRGLAQPPVAIESRLSVLLQTADKLVTDARAVVDKIPARVPIDFMRSWRNIILLMLSPLMLVMLLLLATGTFSKEPVATYNNLAVAYTKLREDAVNLKKRDESLRQRQAVQQRELEFYRSEVQRYRQQFPKSRTILRLYAPARK
jgi:hypothetical protein